MRNRLDLHAELLEIVDNVYFQPPESIKLTYPCIVYNLRDIDIRSADDLNYKHMKSYDITVICKNPDNIYHEDILKKFKHCRFDRYFVNDNLHHYTFVIFY